MSKGGLEYGDVQIPFNAQYGLMSTLQRWLERACYEVGMRRWPKMMLERGWDCAEAVKLEDWRGVCREGWRLFTLDLEKEELDALFVSLAAIRDVLVDRIRLGAGQIDKVMMDAARLMEGLEVKSVVASIGGLRSKVQEVGSQLGDIEKGARERESKELEELRVRFLHQQEEIQERVRSEIGLSRGVAKMAIEVALREAEDREEEVNEQNKQGGLWGKEEVVVVDDYGMDSGETR